MMKKNLLVLLVFGVLFSLLSFNGHAQEDVTPPEIDLSSIKINKNFFYLDELAEISFQAKDDLSGVAEVTFMFVNKGGANWFEFSQITYSAPPNVYETYKIYRGFGSINMAMDYHLNRIIIKDVAGNERLYRMEEHDFSHLNFTAARREFSDVPETYWAYPLISSALFYDRIQGYEDNTFRPNNPITRAEAVKIAISYLGLDVIKEDLVNPNFKDITPSHWAYKSISRGVKHNLIKGYEDNTFRPNDFISRAEVATMLARFAGISDGDQVKTYSDVPKTHWAYDAINNLTSLKIVQGYQDGTFKPNSNITRAEFIVMMSFYNDFMIYYHLGY